MNQELLSRSLKPGHSSLSLLHEMDSAARGDVVSALAAAVVRAEAVELADALAGEPLAAARKAAERPVQALEEAKKALAKEKHALAAQLAAFFDSPRRGDPDDREREPERDTPRVRELQAAVAAAEADAFPVTQAVRLLEEQIDGLRAAPAPDAAVLAVLAAALVGGRLDDAD